MIYTIKPLEWEGDEKTMCDWDGPKSETPFGSYEIMERRDPRERESPIVLIYCFNEYYDEGVISADSVEHAKELAWKDWTKRLEGALIPCVIATSQSPALMTTSLLQVPPDEKTLKQIERVFADSAFYTNDLNP